MRMIAPRTGHEEFTVAEDQLQYSPLVVNRIQYTDGLVILARFQPSEEERKRIAAGDDVFVGQLNFGSPMTPLIVQVGPGEFAKVTP